jgi:hypothetical protein
MVIGLLALIAFFLAIIAGCHVFGREKVLRFGYLIVFWWIILFYALLGLFVAIVCGWFAYKIGHSGWDQVGRVLCGLIGIAAFMYSMMGFSNFFDSDYRSMLTYDFNEYWAKRGTVNADASFSSMLRTHLVIFIFLVVIIVRILQ